MGPFSCSLTLADLFLDFLLLKVSLMIFQRKLHLIQLNMKSNYGYASPTIIRYISSETTPHLKLHMACYEVFLLRWIPRSIYNSGHLPCLSKKFEKIQSFKIPSLKIKIFFGMQRLDKRGARGALAPLNSKYQLLSYCVPL